MPTDAPAAEAAPSQVANPSLMEAIQAQNAPTVQEPAPVKPEAPPAKKEAAPPAKAEVKPPAKAAPDKNTSDKNTPDKTAKGKIAAIPALGEEAAEPEATDTPESAQPEPVEVAPKELKPEAATRWGELRKAETELKSLRPQFESLQKELQAIKEKPPLPEEIGKELEDHRQFRAAYDWQNSSEYQTAVAQPMQKQWSTVKEVVDFLEVDPGAVEKAMAEPNRLRRNELIRAALTTSEKEVDGTAISEVCTAATTLHEIHAKGSELEAKAKDLRNVLKGRQEQETQAQQQAREETFRKASDETYRALSTKLGEFMKDEAVAQDVKTATVAEDPMDQAYQAQAGAILPAVIKALNVARQELAEAKKQAKARSLAKPELASGGRSPEPPSGEQPLGLQEAIAMTYPGMR